MGLFGRNKDGVTDDDRYSVLHLAKDEDYTLFEFITRIGGEPKKVRLAVNDLLGKKMLEVLVIRPDRERLTLNPVQAANVLSRPQSWQEPTAGKDKFLIMATDKGWRWHEKNWKPHN